MYTGQCHIDGGPRVRLQHEGKHELVPFLLSECCASHKLYVFPNDVINTHRSGVNDENSNAMRQSKGRNGILGSGGP